MSKVILVFEKPETCGGCPCMNMRGGFVCQEEWRDVEDPDHVPMWCPLKPLPEKKEAYAESYTERVYEFSAKTHPLYADGWNACLEEIIGETE